MSHESKFFKKIDTLCDPNFTIVLLFTNFSLKITSFSNFQFLIPLSCEKADRVFVLLMWARMRLSMEIYLGGRKLQCQTQQRDGVQPGNLGASRVSIRMDDRTDGQRTDDGTHGFRGGFISHPDVLYYI